MESTIQKYEAFLETVDQGSFTKAAESLTYTQSGVSRMVAELERSWGLRLLDRSRGGVTLTSEGSLLLPFIREICAKQRNLQMEIDNISGLRSGSIRIGTFSSVAAQWLPAAIKAFQADYPGIDCDLMIGDYTQIERWIVEGRADCGFLITPTIEELHTISLGSDHLFAVLPQTHPLAAKKVVPIVSLEGEPFLLPEKSNDMVVSDLLAAHGVRTDIKLTTPDDYVIMSMVESGLGLSILPELILERTPYDIAIRPLDVKAIREICFAVKNQEGASLAVRTFQTYLTTTR